MVTKTSTTSNAPAADAPASVSSASASATATVSSAVIATAPAPSPSDCLKTTASVTASSSGMETSSDIAALASAPRFSCVSPSVLQTVKTSLTYRKSCLKRSNSSVLPSTTPCGHDDSAVEVMELLEVVEKDAKLVQKNRRRCWLCTVKVGLTAVKCRCDYTFCSKHRYAEEHNCAYNFKTAGKRKLEEENPVVVPAKFARIN